MSKELEAFDILLQHIETEADWSDYEKVKNAHKIVEQALQRLEAIENTKPSKALNELNDLTDYLLRDGINISTASSYPFIKQALIKAQEQEEVLDILKKYAKNDGWSDGWTIEFWNMKEEEINKVCKWLTRKDKNEQ